MAHSNESSLRRVDGNRMPRHLPEPVQAAFVRSLLSSRLVSPPDLRVAEEHAEREAVSLPEALAALGTLGEPEIYQMLARASSLRFVDLSTTEISRLALKLLPERVARRHLIVPLREDNRVLTYAAAHPFDDEAHSGGWR